MSAGGFPGGQPPGFSRAETRLLTAIALAFAAAGGAFAGYGCLHPLAAPEPGTARLGPAALLVAALGVGVLRARRPRWRIAVGAAALALAIAVLGLGVPALLADRLRGPAAVLVLAGSVYGLHHLARLALLLARGERR